MHSRYTTTQQFHCFCVPLAMSVRMVETSRNVSPFLCHFHVRWISSMVVGVELNFQIFIKFIENNAHSAHVSYIISQYEYARMHIADTQIFIWMWNAKRWRRQEGEGPGGKVRANEQGRKRGEHDMSLHSLPIAAMESKKKDTRWR